MRAAGLALLVVLGVQGCSVSPRRMDAGVPDLARQSRAAALDSWHLRGRVAVSDGREGGSGRFDWVQDGEAYVMTIRAPVSNQTWRLSGSDGHARLEGAGPDPVEGPDAEELLAEKTGWRLPVRQLRAWVRALPDSSRGVVRSGPDGMPLQLRESGWTLEYRDYDRALQPPMPTRIAASRAPYKVRLAISSWNLDE